VKETYYTFTSTEELDKQFGASRVRRRVWHLPAQLRHAWACGLPTGVAVTMEDIVKWSDKVAKTSVWSDKYDQSPAKCMKYYLSSERDACLTSAHVKIENK